MIPVGAKIDLCDAGHQAIAFVGTCPLCQLRPRSPYAGPRPLKEGRDTIISELDRVLREHYA